MAKTTKPMPGLAPVEYKLQGMSLEPQRTGGGGGGGGGGVYRHSCPEAGSLPGWSLQRSNLCRSANDASHQYRGLSRAPAGVPSRAEDMGVGVPFLSRASSRDHVAEIGCHLLSCCSGGGGYGGTRTSGTFGTPPKMGGRPGSARPLSGGGPYGSPVQEASQRELAALRSA
jgi:hypothetical protein